MFGVGLIYRNFELRNFLPSVNTILGGRQKQKPYYVCLTPARISPILNLRKQNHHMCNFQSWHLINGVLTKRANIHLGKYLNQKQYAHTNLLYA